MPITEAVAFTAVFAAVDDAPALLRYWLPLPSFFPPPRNLSHAVPAVVVVARSVLACTVLVEGRVWFDLFASPASEFHALIIIR
jgi:hypothetical protein